MMMREWRGTHKIARVLQEGRVYILDSGQKVHFERLKPHNSGPTEWATIPANNGDEAVIMDPESEQTLEEIPDDASQPSYREKPISEASNTSLPPRQTLDGHQAAHTHACRRNSSLLSTIWFFECHR